MAFTFLMGMCFSFPSLAVNISEYRIFLDDEHRTKSFIVYNREVEPQECHLRLRHYNFDEKSQMSMHKGEALPENSAKNWIRFSPKKFTLSPARSQTIRFTLRRKANATDAEYRSYIAIDCGAETRIDSSKQEQKLVSVKPKLMHNVPVIARVGKLQAKASIENIKVKGQGIAFDIVRSGNRSIYGEVALIDKNSDEIVSFQKGFSIYPESKSYSFVLSKKGLDENDLRVRFTENKNYGGSIVIERDAVAK